MQRWHYFGGIAVSDGQGYGTVACTSQGLATLSQEGEAEVE
jgi:hypothetical protein